MGRRIVRSLMALAALVVAYQAYVLLAVPWLEPPLRMREARPVTADERAGAQLSVAKYQRLLSHYFHEDHWSQVRPPVVILSGGVMLVLDRYDLRNDYDAGTGRRISIVEIERCALVVFPTPFQEGVAPPGDAIIVEAPQGATLEFDEGFRPERAEISQIKHGVFPGKITIRSNMQSPGPEDDLLIETSDLTMNTKLLYTNGPVRFRMGPNVGSGRELEIRFLDEEHGRRNSSGLNLSGVASLEVRRDVRLRLHLETDGLLPGAARMHRSRAERGNEDVARGSEHSPVDLRCSGPFHFDFVRQVASFDRDIELRQVHPDGPSDQLSAQQLDVHFLPEAGAGVGAARGIDPAGPPRQNFGRLRPAVIVAQGHPVVVTSPAREAEARGEQIHLVLGDQKVTIRSRQQARLVYGPNVIRAPTIEYQHPAEAASTTLGNFRASGPGSLGYVPDSDKPEEKFVAAWQTSLELARREGQPVVALTGRPRFSAGEVGQLTADEMRVHLREHEQSEQEPQGAGMDDVDSDRSRIARGDGSRPEPITLERLTASGGVQIESPELSVRTERLVASFRDRQSDGAARAPSSQQDDAARLELSRRGGQPDEAYYVESDEVQLQVALEDRRASPTRLVCKGNVVLREIPRRAVDQEPLEVSGGELVAEHLNAAAQITIRGEPPRAADKAGEVDPAADFPRFAQISARGMTVTAPEIRLDQGENRLWIASAGKATVLATRGLDGQPSANPLPLEIRWQDGLSFDGRTITFDRDVVVEGGETRLRCNRLTATLTAPVEFGASASQTAVDVAEIKCLGHVVLDQRSRDAAGPTSHHRLELSGLVLNQQTGAISGDGPGVVRSTHFTTEMNALSGPAAPRRGRDLLMVGGGGGPAGQPVAKASRPRLHFLRIDFQRGLGGNLYTRELTFSQRVRTVYGPVDAWEQELDPNRPEALPPESLLLTCDELRVSEDPLAARAADPHGAEGQSVGPVQLSAEGNVQIDGESEAQGVFRAQAERASYEQSKDVFILEGSTRDPAHLWVRQYMGHDSAPYAARKIIYTRATGDVKVEGIQYFEFTPSDLPRSR